MNNILEIFGPWRKQIYYLGISLGIILFFQQLWQGSQAIYQQTFYLENPIDLITAISMTLIAYTLQMLAWAQLMQGLGVALNLTALLQGYIISFLPRYIPGTIWGYLSRNEWLKNNYNVPYTTSNFGSLLEAGLIILTAGVISVAYYGWQILPTPIFSLLIIPGFLFICWGLWQGLNLALNFSPLKFHKSQASLVAFPINFYRWLTTCIIYLGMWSFHGISLSLLLNAFNIDYTGTLIDMTFISSLAWLTGFVVLIVPSGLGIREMTLSRLLVLQSVSSIQLASATAIISRFLLYLAEFILLIGGGMLTWFSVDDVTPDN